jgi:succinate dehydrogenase/fumarate reductase flavoprotein subunit
MGVRDDSRLRSVLVENVADTVAWLRGIGINFLAPLPQPPHTADRLHQVMPTSRAYVVRLQRHCLQLGVQIRLSTPVIRLIVENDTVIGVEAGNPRGAETIHSRAGVILASGDVGGDAEMMHRYMKTWSDGVEVYNPNNTGDGHKMALAIGAAIVPRKDLGFESAAHIRFIRPKPNFLQTIHPHPILTRLMALGMKHLPKWVIRPLMMQFLTTVLGPDARVFAEGAILVNKLGERVGSEGSSPNILLPKQPDGIAYIIFDESFARKFSRWPHFISTAPGVAFAYIQDYRAARPDLFGVGRTTAELAHTVGFDPEKLTASIDDANRHRPRERQLTRGPFYSLGPVKTWVLVAPIGLSVNERFEVLKPSGEAIGNLYAVGHAGMAGFTMTGHGHGLGWAFTSGRLAAENAAKKLRDDPVTI